MPFLLLAPPIFVFIWSSGWIVAKYAAPFADPLTFLALRYAVAIVLLAAFALTVKAEWPKTRAGFLHAAASGVLLHAVYLGAVWWAIARGLPAGISALIAALQPLLTAMLAARLVGEKLNTMQLAGIVIGFVGVLGVIAPKLFGVSADGLSGLGLAALVNVIGMVSVTLGTFYQKKFVASGDLRTVTVLQYAGALVATLPFALVLEPMRIEWRAETWFALGWSVIVLSIGAISLMLMLIRRGAITKLAALVYLVPPTAALQACFMFGETLGALQLAFMAVTVFGVWLASRPAKPAG